MTGTETDHPDRTGGTETSGLLLVDKPAGFTSHDIVAIARGATRTRRIGHTGTLDPFATGLLVLLVGQATRLARFADGEPKVYEATIRFGTETDTDDLTGTETRVAPLPARAEVERGIAQLTGVLEQLPPAYSAKLSGGVRAYDAARKGRPLELKPVPVTVREWVILSIDEVSVTARITCSGGTYVRALGRDLGRLAGSAAHLSALRRIATGPFTVDEACPIDDLRAGRCTLRPMRDAVRSMAVHALSSAELARIEHGNPIEGGAEGGHVALIAPGERLAAIAEGKDGRLQPVVVFPHG